MFHPVPASQVKTLGHPLTLPEETSQKSPSMLLMGPLFLSRRHSLRNQHPNRLHLRQQILARYGIAFSSECNFNLAFNSSCALLMQPPADALPAFRDFVTSEKQRLTLKRQALQKSEKDKRMAELVKFSQSFKVCP
jgi:hypothetical protein